MKKLTILFLMIFALLDAVDATGAKEVSATARGYQKTSGGFKWSYTKLES